MHAIELDTRECHEDLYELYLELIERGRMAIEMQTKPGTLRSELLKDYITLPREHFEARLESLMACPDRYEAAVVAIRRGY